MANHRQSRVFAAAATTRAGEARIIPGLTRPFEGDTLQDAGATVGEAGEVPGSICRDASMGCLLAGPETPSLVFESSESWLSRDARPR